MSLRWLPNAISVFRVLLVAPVAYLILQDEHHLALVLFFVAGFSDALDGFLARTFNWHSKLGALLDPLADKTLLTASYITLCMIGLIPLWLAVLVVVRDIVIVSGATLYNFLIKPLQGEPTFISKLNTTLEVLFVLAVLSGSAFDWPGMNLIIMLGAAVFTTVVISGIDYVWTWSAKAHQGRQSTV